MLSSNCRYQTTCFVVDHLFRYFDKVHTLASAIFEAIQIFVRLPSGGISELRSFISIQPSAERLLRY